jgi:succinate-acetate transporter protein
VRTTETPDALVREMSDARGRTAAEASAWESLRQQVSISLRPIGAPSGLGFFGLGAASFALSGLQLGWVPAGDQQNVAFVLVAFAFGAQLVASVFSFLARDGAAATAMGVLALTWLVVGLTLMDAAPGSTSDALGMFLLFAGMAVGLSGVTVALGKLVPAAVFIIASARFVLVALYEMTGTSAWEDVGLVLFALAMYAAWAVMLEDATGKPVLPLGRRNEGRTAVVGTLLDQLENLPREPGVRAQL